MHKLAGANMDIDLNTQKKVDWPQDECPWNQADGTSKHKCAVKDTSLCEYFKGVEYPDKVLCSYKSK